MLLWTEQGSTLSYKDRNKNRLFYFSHLCFSFHRLSNGKPVWLTPLSPLPPKSPPTLEMLRTCLSLGSSLSLLFGPDLDSVFFSMPSFVSLGKPL